jgi:hypothetical protein
MANSIWKAVRSGDDVYYFNVDTNETQWDRPTEGVVDDGEVLEYDGGNGVLQSVLDEEEGAFGGNNRLEAGPQPQSQSQSQPQEEEDPHATFDKFLMTSQGNSIKATVLLNAINFAKRAQQTDVSDRSVLHLDMTVQKPENAELLKSLFANLLERQFNTNIADELFKKLDIHCPPPWLEALLRDDAARAAIQRLYKENPQSLFLKYCARLV